MKTIEPELMKEEDLTQNYFVGFRTDLGIKFIFLQGKGVVIKSSIQEGIAVLKEGDENSDAIFLMIKNKMPKAEKLPVLEFYNKENKQ